MHVSGCDLLNVNWNPELPSEMPLLENYKMVNSVPRYEINAVVTKGSSSIVQKNLADRFISEDPINCPVLTYKIEKVISSNNS